MATPVEAPKLGNTVEEVLIARWAKRKGDVVAAGELVAEIETDKATFEVTAPVNGILLETFFEEGALVPVFTNLFVIGEPGENGDAFRPGADAAELLTLSARIKASKGVPDININDLVTFCTIKALLAMPELNVEFIDGALVKHAEVHIGFAVDTPRGLLVAVVRNAHALQIGE